MTDKPIIVGGFTMDNISDNTTPRDVDWHMIPLEDCRAALRDARRQIEELREERDDLREEAEFKISELVKERDEAQREIASLTETHKQVIYDRDCSWRYITERNATITEQARRLEEARILLTRLRQGETAPNLFQRVGQFLRDDPTPATSGETPSERDQRDLDTKIASAMKRANREEGYTVMAVGGSVTPQPPADLVEQQVREIVNKFPAQEEFDAKQCLIEEIAEWANERVAAERAEVTRRADAVRAALVAAQEELRLIRMKDTTACYNPALSTQISVALTEYDRALSNTTAQT